MLLLVEVVVVLLLLLSLVLLRNQLLGGNHGAARPALLHQLPTIRESSDVVSTIHLHSTNDVTSSPEKPNSILIT